MMQTQDGVWATRWGTANYGTAYTGPVTGFSDYVQDNGDGTTTQGLMIVDNGTIKYGTNGGAWTSVTGHTVDTTNWTNMLQYQNKILVCNGVDDFGYVDMTTTPFSWVSFTSLSAPGTVTAALSSGLTTGSYNLYYQVTAISKVGETTPSAVTTQTVDIDRNNWYNPQAANAASTYYVDLSWTQISGAIGYNIYLSDGVSGVSYYLDSVNDPGGSGGTIKYRDYGAAAINDFIEVPVSNTTTAPKFTWLALSDNRLWATGDPDNPNRIYWAGVGSTYALAFSPFAGGGWVDIMPGGRYWPKFVGQFRDGKGDPMTTVLLSEPSGYGATWHINITTATIGNTVIAVPTLMQSMGTFGSGAPRSVIETNQNIYFHSGGVAGIYSTGSIPTLFNVLATNEVSILIRPDLQSLNLDASKDICATEFDRKLWYSVPYGTTTNNRIMIHDLEKQNWNPYAFDFGVKGFVRYTDNTGTLRLLAVPETGTSLIEFSDVYTSDNGTAFQTDLQTGLIHVSPDHVQFAHLTYVYYEFGSPQGPISMIFSGTPKNLPLDQLADYTENLGTASGTVGFSSYAFSTEPFSYATGKVTSVGQLSTKQRIRINKLINNWEIAIGSLSPSAYFTFNQVTVVGQYVPTADPSAWIVN